MMLNAATEVAAAEAAAAARREWRGARLALNFSLPSTVYILGQSDLKYSLVLVHLIMYFLGGLDRN